VIDVWATARSLADYLEGVARQISSELSVPVSGRPLMVGGWVDSRVDESGGVGRDLYVEVRLRDRGLADGGRVHDCVIMVRVKGLCSLLVTASGGDVHTAVIEASARAVRSVESRMAIATWPAAPKVAWRSRST
jgi:hypothetical protein